MSLVRKMILAAALLVAVPLGTLSSGCSDDDAGGVGPMGLPGTPGTPGTPGSPGTPGTDGTDGTDGTNGTNGTNGTDGTDGVDATTPTPQPDLPSYVVALADGYARDTLADDVVFPLSPAGTDDVRAIEGLGGNVVAKWRDPLTFDAANTAPRFGANSDFSAFVGDDWEVDGNPYFGGSSTEGWLWINHEYISNNGPTATSAPTGQALTLALDLERLGVLTNDPTLSVWDTASIDKYIVESKRSVGGSWMRVVKDPASGEWTIDRSARNRRFDATSGTRTRITGLTIPGADQADDGSALPIGVAPGIIGDCSGGLTPWGTIITAEENVQFAYGDLEPVWSSNNFDRGAGFDPGALIALNAAPTSGEYGNHSATAQRHRRDLYGYLVEIDPTQTADTVYDTTSGNGHRKLGALGRARWENAAFAIGTDFRLVAGRPIVLYAADDRQGGRVYKFVSSAPYTAGMTRTQTRALLDAGKVYVAHFADLDNATGDTVAGATPTEATPGNGRWIELSLTSTAIAPNATALGTPTKTVAAALADLTWNGIGGFATDDTVRMALFTAASKVGVRELNRPEDVEWNATTSQLFIAFTGHGGLVGLQPNGVLYGLDATDGSWDTARQAAAPRRGADVNNGTIMALEETGDDPTNTGAFTFWSAWSGRNAARFQAELTAGTRQAWEADFVAASVDNLMIDRYGHVFFGTDGNPGNNGGHADSLYYLDLDPAHKTGAPMVVRATYGHAFRIVAGPSDSEATGPWFTPDMRSIFFNVQHPGESVYSTFPDPYSAARPLSSLIAITYSPRAVD